MRIDRWLSHEMDITTRLPLNTSGHLCPVVLSMMLWVGSYLIAAAVTQQSTVFHLGQRRIELDEVSGIYGVRSGSLFLVLLSWLRVG